MSEHSKAQITSGYNHYDVLSKGFKPRFSYIIIIQLLHMSVHLLKTSSSTHYSLKKNASGYAIPLKMQIFQQKINIIIPVSGENKEF